MEFCLDGDNASDLFLHDPLEDASEVDEQEELPARVSSRSSVLLPATGTGDAFYSYLQDIRGLDLLTQPMRKKSISHDEQPLVMS